MYFRLIVLALALCVAATHGAGTVRFSGGVLSPSFYSHNGRYLGIYDSSQEQTTPGQSGPSGLIYDKVAGTYAEALILADGSPVSVPPSFLTAPTAPVFHISNDGNKVFWCHYFQGLEATPAGGCFVRNLALKQTFQVSPTLSNGTDITATYQAAGFSADGTVAALYVEEAYSSTAIPMLARLNLDGSLQNYINPIIYLNGQDARSAIFIGTGQRGRFLTADGSYFYFHTNTALDPSAPFDSSLYRYDVAQNNISLVQFGDRAEYQVCTAQDISSNGRYLMATCFKNSVAYIVQIDTADPAKNATRCNLDNQTGAPIGQIAYETISTDNSGRYVMIGFQSGPIAGISAINTDGASVLIYDTTQRQLRTFYTNNEIDLVGMISSVTAVVSPVGDEFFIGFNAERSHSFLINSSTFEIRNLTRPECPYTDPSICTLFQHQLGVFKGHSSAISGNGQVAAFFAKNGKPYVARNVGSTSTLNVTALEAFGLFGQADDDTSMALSHDGSILAMSILSDTCTGNRGVYAVDTIRGNWTVYSSCAPVTGPVSITSDGSRILLNDVSAQGIYLWNWAVDNSIVVNLNASDAPLENLSPAAGFVSSSGDCAVLLLTAPGDVVQVYLKNLVSTALTRVDQGYTGIESVGAVSANCQYVGFAAECASCPPRQLGGNSLIIADMAGGPSFINGAYQHGIDGSRLSVSSDGRYWSATVSLYNLANFWPYPIVYDRTANATFVGGQKMISFRNGLISADGSAVMFSTFSARMGFFDGNSAEDLYVCTRNTADCRLISVTNAYYANYPQAPQAPPPSTQTTVPTAQPSTVGSAPVAAPQAASAPVAPPMMPNPPTKPSAPVQPPIVSQAVPFISSVAFVLPVVVALTMAFGSL